jgi:hypothetical protein
MATKRITLLVSVFIGDSLLSFDREQATGTATATTNRIERKT